MKFLIILITLTNVALAKCDLKPLRSKIIDEYQTLLPVTNSKGEIGHAKAKNFVVSESLTSMKHDNFLIANFDLDIKWMSGKKQTVRTLVVATVNPKTCTIEHLNDGKRVSSIK